MRKWKKKQVEHVKWRLANPNTPLWVLHLDRNFRKIWRKTDQMQNERMDNIFMGISPSFMVMDEYNDL